MKIKRIIAVCLVSILALLVFAGCDKKVAITDNASVFKIGKETCSLPEAKLMLLNYQNQYRDVYGVDLWKASVDGNKELESYIKDLTISQLAEIYMLAYIGQDQEWELSESELANVEAAAMAYYQSLNDAEIAYTEATEKDVLNLYQHYAMARKVFAEMTESVDQEVSDDEARVMTVLQIFTEKEDAIRVAYSKIQSGSEFSAIAAAYNQAEETRRIIDRSDVPAEAETAVFGLANGEYTDVIAADGGFYIYYCENNYDEELTQKNKESVLAQRMADAVDATYEAYKASTDSKLNAERWNEVEVNSDENLSTISIFDVFEEYCGDDY